MKVAYILERMIGGWLAYELAELGRLGVDIDIHPTNPAVYHEFEAEPGYRRRSLRADLWGSILSGCRHPLKAGRVLTALVPRAGWKIALAALSTARRLERENPSILHAHFATTPAAVAWAVSLLTGIPYGFTAHAYDIFKEPVDRAFLTEKCRQAAFVRSISEYNRRFLVKTTGVDESKFHVIHCGVDTRSFCSSRIEKKKRARRERRY